MGYFEAIWKSILLGTVQGLTEFLPVSSSGHLSLLQRVLHYEAGGLTLVNATLHLGTLFAVIWVFRKEIFALFKPPFRSLALLIAATVPAGAVGLLFHDEIDLLFSGERGTVWLALCFAFTAVLLLAAERVAHSRKKISPLGFGGAMAMGCMQAVALFPGISRSGSTIFAGTVAGAKREDVAKFSFLMSIPVILGSAAVECKGAFFPQAGAAAAMGGAEIVGMFFGVLCAAVSGLFSVKLTLKAVGQANYRWFSLYLAALSLSCLWLNAIGV